MKRFISILTMALLLFAGNAFAQSSSRMEVTLDFNSGSLLGVGKQSQGIRQK